MANGGAIENVVKKTKPPTFAVYDGTSKCKRPTLPKPMSGGSFPQMRMSRGSSRETFVTSFGLSGYLTVLSVGR